MDNTIFDDTFRTIVEKMPELVIPLINEIFHTSYPYDVEVIQLRDEHQDESGSQIPVCRSEGRSTTWNVRVQMTRQWLCG